MAAAAAPQDVTVLKEHGISIAEMDQQLREFLRRQHVKNGLSSEDYTRLQALQRALKHETQQLEVNEEGDEFEPILVTSCK